MDLAEPHLDINLLASYRTKKPLSKIQVRYTLRSCLARHAFLLETFQMEGRLAYTKPSLA